MKKGTGAVLALKLIVIFITVHFTGGQLPALDPERPIHQYLLDQWDAADGLPGSNIRAIVQTPDGYLWIATSKGLVRYDGVTFFPLQFVKDRGTENEKSVSPDALAVDKEGILWIGSSDGLTEFRYKTGLCKNYTKQEGLTGNRIRRLKKDLRGNLWIGFVVSYLSRFTDGTFTPFNGNHGLKGKKVTAIVESMKGDILVGTRENGVFRLRHDRFVNVEIHGLGKDHLIITMCEDREGSIWIGTNKGLFRVKDGGTKIFTTADGLSNDFIIAVIQDRDGSMWVGSVSGLNRITKDRTGKTIIDSVLGNCIITYLFEDREKSLWIGTDDSGLKRLKNRKFISYVPIEKYEKKIMISLFEDRRGYTWIGSLTGELYKCKGSRCIETIRIPQLTGTGISAIREDGEGNLWLGTNGKGVFFKRGDEFINLTTRDGLADNVVISIFLDGLNNIWIATSDGVSVYRDKGIQSFRNRDGLSGKAVHNVFEDGRGNIWLASDKGINVLEKGRMTRTALKKYLNDIPVTCIYRGSDGDVLWIATRGAGLKRFKDGDFVTYNTETGMSSNFIYQLLGDKSGFLWMMSDSGVLRVSTGELNRFARGEIARVVCTSYGIHDGMKSTEFYNKTSSHSALKTRNGELRFATKKGISIVNPDNIKLNKLPPAVLLEKIVPTPLRIRGTGQLAIYQCWRIDDITFHFTAPSFLSPEKITFKYKLEGYDNQWRFLPAGKKRVAVYKNVRPSTYTFRVTACNSDGVWNRRGASVTFSYKPVFYKTTLFIVSSILVVLLLVFLGYVLYKKRMAGKNGKYKHSNLNPIFMDECIKKLNYFMDIDRIYRDETLSLQSLAEKISVTPHQLSRILNDRLNKNFADFINTYRVEEVKRLLRDPKSADRKLLSIAFDAGFNTKTAFNNTFKKYTKTTPSEYRKEISKG